MAVAVRMKDFLAQRATENFIGRAEEVAAVLECLEPHGPLVVYLHGIAGIGKSTLLGEIAKQALDRGAAVVHLDGRFMEPSPQGFLQELAKTISSPVATLEDAAQKLEDFGTPVLIAVDTCELLRMLDAWIRQTFIPALPERARVVLSGRLRPLPSWLVAPEWQGLFRDLPIGPLGEHDVVEALTRRGHGEQAARRVYSLTRGHPLAMGLAVTAMAGRSGIGRLEQIASQGLVQRLAEICLMDAADPLTRRAAEAGSIVRRVTRSLLAAMLPDADAETAYEQLKGLSFVDDSVEGLIVHDAVREAISSALRCSNPTRHRQYRRDAWRQLRAEMRLAAPSDMWRYAADMLYLAEEPCVREAFFPSGAHELSVEQARAGDGESIRTIVERNESPSAAKILLEWWERAPDGFRVLRGYDGKVKGCCLFLYPEANANWGSHDPLARACVRHLEQRPVPRSQQAIYLRRWLSLDRGERPSPVQGACWLEAKRSYVSLRSSLRRCYISVCDLAEYGPVAQRLGFRVVEPATTNIDGQAHHLAVLDFGPGAVESWLPQVAAREMGIAEHDILDTDARELVLDGERTGLTELEFGVMRHLCHRADKPVSRADLLEEVWGHTQDCGSNVVDVVIRSLRKKLGDRASAIETVRGVGYRFRA